MRERKKFIDFLTTTLCYAVRESRQHQSLRLCLWQIIESHYIITGEHKRNSFDELMAKRCIQKNFPTFHMQLLIKNYFFTEFSHFIILRKDIKATTKRNKKFLLLSLKIYAEKEAEWNFRFTQQERWKILRTMSTWSILRKQNKFHWAYLHFSPLPRVFSYVFAHNNFNIECRR